jgi:hypothetical protein
MLRYIALAALAMSVIVLPAQAAGITGHYVEARTCDVWTGPCFANADFNLTGKNAVMAWRVDKGAIDNVSLDGLGVVAVISASDTLGLEQTGPASALLIVDERATAAQRKALVQLAKKQGGKLVANVVGVRTAPVSLTICECKNNACSELKVGSAKAPLAHIKTRCLNADHDKACGNETAFYPPLTKGVRATPAAAEHAFQGTGLRETWREYDRRGAYVGSFEIN